MNVVPPSWKAGAAFVVACAEDDFSIASPCVLELLVDCVRDDNGRAVSAEQIEALDFAVVKSLLDQAQELMAKKNSESTSEPPTLSVKGLE